MNVVNKPPFLEIKNVSYSYPGNKPVLDNCSFAVSSERIGLIGPNGSGKTTLLHLMVGLLKPQRGEILFNGVPIRKEQEYRELRKNVGFLFQNSDDQLFSPTVIEDIAFGPLNLGMTPEKAYLRAHETLVELGLTHIENRVTHRLSGGEKKLVALATILSMHPRLLLLDEPSNNLDPKTRSHIISILKALDLALVVISHDWDFLDETTDILYTIEHGHLRHSKIDFLHEHKHVHTLGDKPHHHSPR